MIGIFFLIFALFCSWQAHAQVLQQSGHVTPGHVGQWTTSGLLQDGGSATNGSITNLGLLGTGFPACINDAPVGRSGGYHQLCLGSNVLSGGAVISYNAYNGASPLPLSFNINGTTSVPSIFTDAPLSATLTATTAPSSICNPTSFYAGFSCDLSHVPIAIGLDITGTATLGEPSSGYMITPNLSTNYTLLQNSSGWNQSTSGNSGRTGAYANYTTAIQTGQGDVTAYFGNVVVSSAKSGATNFLAQPAGGILGGQVTLGTGCSPGGCYMQPLGDLNCSDAAPSSGYYDASCIGAVFNFFRGSSAATLGDVWVGLRMQSLGSQSIDGFASFTGPSAIGIDLTGATLGSNAGLALAAGQGIYLNGTAGGCCDFPSSTTVGTTTIYYSTSNSTINLQTNGNASLQVGASQVNVATTNGLAIAGTGILRFIGSNPGVCFQTSVDCWIYSTATSKWFLTNASGTSVLSVDQNGNVRALGTITPSTTP